MSITMAEERIFESRGANAPSEGIWVLGYGSLLFKPPPLCSFKVNGYLKGFVRRFWQSSSDHRGTPEKPGRVVTLVSLKDIQTNAVFHSDLHRYELRSTHQETSLVADPADEDSKIDDVVYRIANLKEDDLRVWGCAYWIAPENVEEVKQYLDVREQDGYTTHRVPFHVLQVPQDVVPEVLDSVPRDEDTGDMIIESMIYIGTIDNESFVGPENIDSTAKIIRSSRGPSGENIEYLAKLAEAVRSLDEKGRSRDFYLEDLLSLVNS